MMTNNYNAVFSSGNNLQVKRNTIFELSHQHIYKLNKGVLKIIHFNNDGSHRIKYIILSGEIFGGLAYLMGGKKIYTEYAEALENADISVIHIDQFDDYIQLMPDGYRSFLESVGRRIIKLERRIDSMVFGNASQRIVNLLLEYAKSYGKRDGNIFTAPNYLTHLEISTLTGTSRQTVTKVLNQLRQQKKIEYNTREIIVHILRFNNTLFGVG
jgi:CRP-like cAMP-binding protein